jgi:hypothetical protein
VDGDRFDCLVRSLRGSRRSLLGGALVIGGGRLDAPGAKARKKRPRKLKKPTPNAYGCLNVGAACQNAGQCCSGICGGKTGKKTCRAHDVGNCRTGQAIGFCGGMNSACAIGGGNPTGVCGTTTGNAGFCVGGGDCYSCTEDAQCRPFCGAGAACVRCERCTETGGAMCASAGIHICEF